MSEWINKNKLLLALVLIFVLYEFGKGFFGVGRVPFLTSKSVGPEMGYASSPASSEPDMYSGVSNIALPYPPTRDFAPQTDVKNRLVIQESNMSLLVKDVVDVRNKIIAKAESLGGYMVNASTSNPQDAPTSTVVVRVPANSLQNTLDYFHSLSVKVVSENLVGHDVTDQFVDIDTRIAQLQKTKLRLEAILSDAKEIADITNLTQQILSYQNQIDNLKGQQMSLEKNAELAKLTVYLSTDEIALPYAPSETFRPAVIFKLAVRSLVGTLRNLAEDIIWIAVYSIVWLPILGIILFIRKWFKDRWGQPSSK